MTDISMIRGQGLKMNMHTDRYYDSYDAMAFLFDRYSASDRYKGNDEESLKEWQTKERTVLKKLIGLDKLLDGSMDAALTRGPNEDDIHPGLAVISSEKLPEGIIRKKCLFRVDEYTYMPMFVLYPAEKPKGTFLALAGHQGGGKYSVAGVIDGGIIEEKTKFFNYDYGLKLARLGYTTICPDPRGFGERRDKYAQGDDDKDIISCSCRNLGNMAISLGLTVVGLCVYDYIKLIEHITQSDEFDTDNLGVIGFSGGGMQALYLSALDTRVKRTFISGYMYGVKDALLTLNNNCSCNYVPGLWEHFDMGDIACMIAPRPLIIQSCQNDHLNGARGIVNVYEQLDLIKNAYRIYDREDRLVHDIRPGEHHFHDEPLEGWLSQTCREEIK